MYTTLLTEMCVIREAKKTSPYSILFDTALEYFKKVLGISNVPVKLKWLKSNPKSHTYGSVDMLDFLNSGKAIVELEQSGTKHTLGSMVHELVHVKQMIKKELSVGEDSILWKGEPHIRIEEYVSNRDYTVWKNLPWEVEADSQKKILVDKFLGSKEFKDLAKINDTLKFIVSIEIQ